MAPPKKNRTGENNLMNCGMEATIIHDDGWNKITVQFEDGTIVENRSYDQFKDGRINNPNLPNHNFKDRTGETRTMNNGEQATIIKYIKDNNITIQFDNGYVVENQKCSNFKAGKLESPFYKSVYEIGYIGVGKYNSTINNKQTDVYKAWTNMFSRCYSLSSLKYHPTYFGCTVDKDFYCFQDFAEWYYKNMWGEGISYQVDKDILFKGNKVYSKDKCMLVDNRLNNFLQKSRINNGEYPIGVTFSKRLNAFVPQLKIDGKSVYLGMYDNPVDAFYKYKEEKEKYIKKIANEYKQKYNDFPEKLYNALINYEIDIDD